MRHVRRKMGLHFATFKGFALSLAPVTFAPIPSFNADAKALGGDWQNVGNDLRTATKKELARGGTYTEA